MINFLGFETSNLKLDNRFYGRVEEENGVKYLTISDISKNSDVLTKYDLGFSGIKHHIKKINNSDCEYDEYYKKNRF